LCLLFPQPLELQAPFTISICSVPGAQVTWSIFLPGGRPNRNSARNLDIYIRTGRIPITKQDNDLQNLLKWAFKAGNHDARFGGGRHQIAGVGISTIWSK
jgi:hypothetical protein